MAKRKLGKFPMKNLVGFNARFKKKKKNLFPQDVFQEVI